MNIERDETVDHSPNAPRRTYVDETIPATDLQLRGHIPIQIGSYLIVGEIARGGMGIVYRATDTRLKRDAAIKVIRSGSTGDEEIRRFLVEAQSSAKLEHANIVPVFESGEFDGQPFIALAFVDGSSLWNKVSNQPMEDRRAAALFVDICDAIGYAHSKGIIHRDLKPQNILISQEGTPRVTDFGLAKSTNSDSSLTREGTVMGTPSYMPPEQALGHIEDVNELSDVYSLGATLYASLTTRPPFQAANPIETIRQVVESEPIPPSSLNVNVAKDLETICLKALQKDPSKRYASAADMKEDLRRFLNGEPILARRISSAEKLWRWCRRNRLTSSAIAMTALLLVGTASVSTLAYLRERELTKQKQSLINEKQQLADSEVAQRKKAEQSAVKAKQAESKAQDRLQRARIINGDRFVDTKEAGKALAWHLHAWRNSNEGSDDSLHRLRVFHDIKSARVQLTSLAIFDSPVVQVTLSNNRDQVLVVTEGKKIYLREPKKLDKAGPILTFTEAIINTAWSASDQYFATLTQFGTIQVWATKTGELLHTRRLAKVSGRGLAFHPQDHSLYYCNEDGKLAALSPGNWEVENASLGTLPVYDFAWRPDGGQLATIDPKQRTELWDWNSKNRLWPASHIPLEEGFDDELSRYMPAFSRDGSVLLMRDATSPKCGKGIALRTNDLSIIISFALPRVYAAYSYWNFDGFSKLACVSYSDETRILDLEAGKERQFIQHPRESNCGLLSHDGKRLVSTSTSGLLHVWNAKTGDSESSSSRHAHTCDSLAFLNDKDQVLVGSRDGTVRVWKIVSQDYSPPRRTVGNSRLVEMDSRYSRDGSRVIRLTDVDWQRGFEVRDLINKKTLIGPIERPHPNRSTWGRYYQQEIIHTPRLSPSGRFAAFSISSSGTIAVWDVDAGECVFAKSEMFLGGLRTLEFSEDEELLVTACSDNTARLWSARNGEPVSPTIPVGLSSFVFMSKDNQYLAHIDFSREPYRLQLLDARTGDRIVELPPVAPLDRNGYESEKGLWVALPTKSGVQLCLGHESWEELKTSRGQIRPIFEYDLSHFNCDPSLVTDIAKLIGGYRVDDGESLAYLSPFEFLDNADQFRKSWQTWLDLTASDSQ